MDQYIVLEGRNKVFVQVDAGSGLWRDGWMALKMGSRLPGLGLQCASFSAQRSDNELEAIDLGSFQEVIVNQRRRADASSEKDSFVGPLTLIPHVA